jgi:cardiolipin synthase (CMP-forming)
MPSMQSDTTALPREPGASNIPGRPARNDLRRLRRARANILVRALNLPNLITLGRVILVPLVFWLVVTGQTQAAFFAFLVAGISDAVDGYLAKSFGWKTELGSYLDPLADKLLVVSIFLALGVDGALPVWLVVTVVSRDILIVIAIMLSWLLGNPMRIRPLAISKANTAAQIVLVATVLADEGFGLGLSMARLVMIWVTGALTVASLAAYLRGWLLHMSGNESAEEKS